MDDTIPEILTISDVDKLNADLRFVLDPLNYTTIRINFPSNEITHRDKIWLEWFMRDGIISLMFHEIRLDKGFFLGSIGWAVDRPFNQPASYIAVKHFHVITPDELWRLV